MTIENWYKLSGNVLSINNEKWKEIWMKMGVKQSLIGEPLIVSNGNIAIKETEKEMWTLKLCY